MQFLWWLQVLLCRYGITCMKKFDGIHPYAYDTIFGIINFDPDGDGYFVVKKVTETEIKYPVIVSQGIIGLRRFKNRTKAYIYIKLLEISVSKKVRQLLIDYA